MKTNTHNIVCISTIDWDFVWQGHQEIMSSLARQGHRVLFIENTGVRGVTLKDMPRLKHRLMNWRRGVKGIRKVMDNLYVYAPLVLPFPYSRVARAVNKALMRWTLRSWATSMRFDSPIVWTWLPTALTLELIRTLDAQLVVYYCCDDFQASSAGSKRIRETEDILLRKADLVFAHSKAILDRCRQFTDQVHVFQYGFNRKIFTRDKGSIPADLAPITHPIIGYVGGVHKHVDQALLEKVATAHPDKSLVLVGPLQTEVDRLTKQPNVHFLGQKQYADLPSYIRQFDVCVIPYELNEYTRSVYPTKLNEYLIMGRPVVSTKLPEVEYFNQCHQGIVAVADGSEAFVACIGEELRKDNETLRAQRIAQVEKNAWAEKIQAMERLIQAKLDEKAKQREIDWQQTLVKVYQSSRRRVAGIVCACLLAYAVLFYTPIARLAGEPLRFEDRPVPADVIVVLAGGIGESGEPGEAYQEKVKQAVALFQQRYSTRLLFMSGLEYVYKEAQVMKALAVSLGVPEQAVFVDERGGGNYVTLLNARQILQERGWTSMLLVTSRYNTVRSRLVVEQNLQGTAVTYLPAPTSAFFGESGSMNWRQLRAIMHEYEAIVYYWMKGYI